MNPAETVAPLHVRAAGAADGDRIAAYVRAHPQGTPFHLPAWVDAVARGTRNRAHLLVAERSGALAGVLPLTEIRSLLFGNALASSGFAVGGGAIGDDDAACVALLDAGWRLAGARKVASLELRGGHLPQGEGWQHKSGTYAGFVRPLAMDDEAELKAIPRKQRADVRKALASELAGDFTVETGRDERAARMQYALYAESVRNLGTPVFPRRLFDEVRAAFGDDADILTVLSRGRPVASVLSLYHNGTVMPYWGGGNREARTSRANEMMYFALMRHARARGCIAFDFGRSKLDSGPYAYKKNWGFAPQPLAYAVRTAGGAEVRDVNPLSPRYQAKIAAWKKLPLWLANRLGPPLARGLG